MSVFRHTTTAIRHLTLRPQPVIVSELPSTKHLLFAGSAPILTPLVFENVVSDARDHCANERNFMSFLRVSIYLYLVGLALLFSFNFNITHPPSDTERRIALPMGIMFMFLALVCLATGVGIYLGTIKKYSRHKALVESGRWTRAILMTLALTICGSCVVLLLAGAEMQSVGGGASAGV